MPDSNTLIGAIKELSQSIGVPLQKIANSIGNGAGNDVPQAAHSDSTEEVILRYTVGTGTFAKENGNFYSALNCKMFKMDGSPDGTFAGVWQPLVPPEQMITPPPPAPPFNKPKGPVPVTDPRAFTKAIWTFGDDSSIIAVGPAELLLVPYKDPDGGQIFLVAAASIITNGTKRYEGAQGTKVASGSTFVPKGFDMFSGQPFGAVTVETFRVIRKEFILS
jgi:hypothetical protein